ncbi:two-component system response regulator FixJ [Rhizomicrobium palustre]|uniref:Two-component system response regulator FixJ n=1 Tax=Rhizomicrobium palustre TaxID=189966 RepID=A0A846N2Q4_9PROT|nr:response regulator [Rhizomicrobium palustre]NIK89893.1 two-component system response regulator FixJ [Rhizomicrobium palustre]
MDRQLNISIVDDDDVARDALRVLLEAASFKVKDYASATAFLDDDVFGTSCVVADMVMPGMDGLSLQREVARRRHDLPVVIVSGFGEIDLAVQAMKAGAVDFLEKPCDGEALLQCIRRALEIGEKTRSQAAAAKQAKRLVGSLTPREKHVLDELVGGLSNKAVAQKLGISPRTVEVYRAQIMTKLKADSLSDLVRTALCATG